MTVTVQVKRSREFEFDSDRTNLSGITVLRAIECREKNNFYIEMQVLPNLEEEKTQTADR